MEYKELTVDNDVVNKPFDISQFVTNTLESCYGTKNNKDVDDTKRMFLLFDSEVFNKSLKFKIQEGRKILYNNKKYSVISIDDNILIPKTCIVNVFEETEDFMDAKRVGSDLKEITQKIHRDDTLKYISKLINVKDDNGKIKNSYTILNELGNIFNKLDKYQQKALCKEIGGERHCNMVKNLILNIH